MSQPVYNLRSQGSWVQVYNEYRAASVVVDSSFTPIPAFELGILFESHVLAVRCLSNSAKRQVGLAELLKQRFQLGTGRGFSPAHR